MIRHHASIMSRDTTVSVSLGRGPTAPTHSYGRPRKMPYPRRLLSPLRWPSWVFAAQRLTSIPLGWEVAATMPLRWHIPVGMIGQAPV